MYWEDIEHVKYNVNDNCLEFWGYKEEEEEDDEEGEEEGEEDDEDEDEDDDRVITSIHISWFTKYLSSESEKACGSVLAEMFTNIAETQRKYHLDDVLNVFGSLMDDGKEEEALKFALGYRADDRCNIGLSDYIAKIYIKKGQAEVGLRILNEDIAYIENNMDEFNPENIQFWLSCLRMERSEIFCELGNKIEARADAVFVKHNFSSENISQEDCINYINLVERIEEIENDFTEHFFEIPYQKRKTFVPVKSYDGIDLMKNTLQVVNINHLPDIKFPVGHPIANQLYIGHPYIPKKYIPFESYEQEFIEDKVREYCQIMQFLGATEINIESINSSDSKSAENFDSKMGGKANVRSASASAESTVNRANQLLESISQSIQLHQKYHPKGAPKLPTDMVWYDNEPSWQRTYKQRMQGSLLEHEERIETKKSRVVNGSELKTLAAEFKVLIVNAGVQWEQSIEEQFESQENVVLSIKVKFAPLESLMVEDKFTSSTVGEIQKREGTSVQKYTEAEEEYIEEIKACLEESYEVSHSERRLLNKLREQLGISEERAIEIETLFQNAN